MDRSRKHARASVLLLAGVALVLVCPTVPQQAAPAPAPAPQSQAAVQSHSPAPSGPPLVLTDAEQGHSAIAVREEELRQQLQGKTFYLRRGYLGDALHFNDAGALDGSAPEASYTLSLVEIDRVHLKRHELELECVRYGLHFLGALPTEDQTQAVDRVRLTTKKKPLKITIDRMEVSKAKEEKAAKHRKNRPSPAAGSPMPGTTTAGNAPVAGSAHPAMDAKRRRASASSEALANIALAKALDNVFAAAIDPRMVATLPEYWRLFYQAAAAHTLYKPADPSIYGQSDVDQKARLISMPDPQSNAYAQKSGVAGVAMYTVVVGADGKPQQIAVGRPIGFGLDETAVAAIQKATFEPAMKHGRPVPVLLDVVVQFRIYSKLTATETATAAKPASKAAAPVLPGPYTVNAIHPQAQPAADTTQQQASPTDSTQPAAQPAPTPASQPSTPQTPQPGSAPQ